jgi:hypothetical protein
MLGDPEFEIVGVAGIVSAVSASQDVAPERHANLLLDAA